MMIYVSFALIALMLLLEHIPCRKCPKNSKTFHPQSRNGKQAEPCASCPKDRRRIFLNLLYMMGCIAVLFVMMYFFG